MSDLPTGAYLASALLAAGYGGDSGEDVDRLIAELEKRGCTVVRSAERDALAAAIERHLRHVSPFRDFDMDHEQLRAAYDAIKPSGSGASK